MANHQRDFDLFENKYAIFSVPDNTPEYPGAGEKESPHHLALRTNNIYTQQFSLDGEQAKFSI
jgi:hypothetical protein